MEYVVGKIYHVYIQIGFPKGLIKNGKEDVCIHVYMYACIYNCIYVCINILCLLLFRIFYIMKIQFKRREAVRRAKTRIFKGSLLSLFINKSRGQNHSNAHGKEIDFILKERYSK